MSDYQNSIINLNNTEYGQTPLFLGQNPGVVDTINKQYPTLWALYKKLKALDWDENEFNFISCKREFQTCDKNTYDIMIKTLAWQWEADSVVSRSVTGIGSNLTSNTELWALWQRIGENEQLHAFTYSEIVRTSFDNPDVILQEILKVQQAHERLGPLVEVLEKTYKTAHELALGMADRNDPAVYEQIILYMTAMYALERVQFIGSFAVTFSIAETGQFMPIGKAVQKICQDEFEIHARADLEILRIEKSTARGQAALNKLKTSIKDIIDRVLETEKQWCSYILSENRELPGLTEDKLFSFVLYCSKEVYEFFEIKCAYEFPEKNPLKFIEKWIDMGKMQSSPQEEKPANYMLGMVEHDMEDQELDFTL